MPFRSDAQRAYLAIHEPKIAHKWAKKYGPSHDLPKHVGDKKSKAMKGLRDAKPK